MWAGEAEGIRYYNDSYATRPEATLAAVDALASAPLALVLGGSDKNIDFTELAAGLLACPSLVHISLIGATAGRLREALTAAGVPPFALLEYPGLDPAFEACEQAVRGTGGAVLLSPACASFGLFANYKERGEAFLKLAAARTGISY
jgi:UDP-N-acetylmuramoylalanine--D-glutamate ligase